MFSSTTRPVCTGLLASALALAGAGIAGPAYASTLYDGDWSVVVTTRQGSCDPSVRYGVEIADGRIINASGSPAEIQGQVTPRGTVRVTVRSGGAWAVGSGRLGRVTGTGVWRGQGSRGFCRGTWQAQRRGYSGGAHVYDYDHSAPGR